MIFDDKFFEEEIMWDHKVTTLVKKVWAVEINILDEIDRICKKYNLRYFAAYGTLLGAIRHKGFIPWDDDLDIVMFRPDYEMFRKVAAKELPEYMVFQGEFENSLSRSFCKVRDSRTTAIEFMNFPKEYNQGLFVDIFPLDDACDGPDKITPEFIMKTEMWAALTTPHIVKQRMDNGVKFILPKDILECVGENKDGQGEAMFSEFCSQHFGETNKIDMLVSESEHPGEGQLKEWYRDTVYLPFNGFNMPVPVDYEKCLIHRFGADYMTPVKFASLHSDIFLDPDNPYTDYIGKKTEDLAVYMRKSVLENITGILGAVNDAADELKGYVGIKKSEELSPVFESLQGAFIEIGEAIESAEGEGCDAVKILEEACELLWKMSQSEEKAFNKESIAVLKAYIKKTADYLNKVKIKKEVVFLPYKASMWDSLESVWREMSDMPEYDTFVVPIPYFDRNPDGTVGGYHYEIADYPKEVPVIDWKDYSIPDRHPDVIYIHNPYDKYNNVTMVHPDFFASELRKHTDELVYIPYFVLQDGEVPEHFCVLPGVIYSHKVIVQSENARQSYIKHLKAYAKKNNLGNAFGDLDKKIVAGGSPKLEKVKSVKREDYDIPDEWKSLIYDEDGNKRKVILYNTSIGTFIKSSEVMLDKLESVMEFFSKQEKVILLWRPHPLYRTTIQTRFPEQIERYDALVKKYIDNKIGIFDDSADMYRAIVWSDAYYGDESSLVELYKQTKKPIMIENTYIMN